MKTLLKVRFSNPQSTQTILMAPLKWSANSDLVNSCLTLPDYSGEGFLLRGDIFVDTYHHLHPSKLSPAEKSPGLWLARYQLYIRIVLWLAGAACG